MWGKLNYFRSSASKEINEIQKHIPQVSLTFICQIHILRKLRGSGSCASLWSLGTTKLRSLYA